MTPLLREVRWGWRRTQARFWRGVAKQVEPHLPQGIHVDGINVTGGQGMTISGVTVRGKGEQPALTITGPPRATGPQTNHREDK